MKNKVFFFAALLLAVALPQCVMAYDFSAVCSTGQTLYYNISGSGVSVTSQNSSYPYYSTFPTGNLEIPSSVTYNGTTYSVIEIGQSAFYYCSNLTSVTIPNSITTIGSGAFLYCSRLASVTIPNSVSSIGAAAFTGCSGLTSVTIGDSVITIGNYAFQNCSGLTSMTIPNSVTSIGYGTFSGCSGLTSVTIPNSVISIGDYAFYNCSGLTSVTIPNSVTSIGSGAFAGCRSLTSITVESGNIVYDSRENCNAIIETSTNTLNAGCMNTVIPNSVTSIDDYAFYSCSSLASVTIPNSVTSIGDYAFYNCSGLTSVTIGDSVTSIGSAAFASCWRLTSVTIPNSVTSIGSSAFSECSGLTSVTIGDSVTLIGDYAFLFCSSITEITCHATTAPTLGTNVFEDVSSTIPVNIPCGSTASYQSAWSYFSNFNEIFPYAFDVQSDDETMGTVSILTQPTCEAPNAEVNATANDGYRFDHWSDGTTDNPYSLAVTQDTALVAYFVTTEGIGDVDGTDAKVTVVDGQIVVEGSEKMLVMLYDATGRLIAMQRNEGVHGGTPLRFDVPASGTYLIKVGNHPARKVVVIR